MKTRNATDIRRNLADAKQRLRELQNHGDNIVINGYQPVKLETAIQAVSNYIDYWQDELEEAIKHGEQLAFAL